MDKRGEFRAAYDSGSSAQLVSGSSFEPSSMPFSFGGVGSPQEPAATTTTQVLTSINPSGGGVTVWPAAGAGGLPVMQAREDFSGGGMQSALLPAPLSGPVGAPVLGGSGNGDALIAFVQGPPDQQQVMAAVAKAPPGQFIATAPVGWVSAGNAKISWEAPPEAFGSSTYAILLDGHERAHGLTGLAARLSSRGLGDGVHSVQVLAIDSLQQQTMTPRVTLKVDADPPEATVKSLPGRRIVLRISDRGSGVVLNATTVSLGDGARSKHRLTVRHSYASAGSYTITVHSRDKVGHSLDVNLRVRSSEPQHPPTEPRCPPAAAGVCAAWGAALLCSGAGAVHRASACF